MALFEDVFGGQEGFDDFGNQQLDGLGAGFDDFGNFNFQNIFNDRLSMETPMFGLGGGFDMSGNPFNSGGLYFDNETGQLVSFEEIMRNDPSAAFRLNPDAFSKHMETRFPGGGGTSAPSPTGQAPSPTNPTSWMERVGLLSTKDGSGGLNLGSLAKLASVLGGTGLAAAGLFSKSGTLKGPEIDPRAQQLLDSVTKQAELQNRLLKDTLKGSQFAKENQLRDLGLDNLIKQLEDPNFLESLFSEDNEIRQKANQELLGVLDRPGQASPELLRQLEEQERQLADDYRLRLGSGFETSTPYMMAKSEFDQRKLEATADDALFRRAQQIQLLSGLSGDKADFLQNTRNQAFTRNLTATGASPTTDSLLKILQAHNTSLAPAQVGLGAYQNQANNLLSADMFRLGEANKNRNALLGGGGQLIGLGLYGLGKN